MTLEKQLETSLGTLMTWKKGQSGNPKGRPPLAPSLTGLLRETLDVPVFVQRLIDLTDPNIVPDPFTRLRAHQLIIAYVDGPPVQQIKQTLEEVHRPRVIFVLPDNSREREALDDPDGAPSSDDPDRSPTGTPD
jgi:hypothetical protein